MISVALEDDSFRRDELSSLPAAVDKAIKELEKGGIKIAGRAEVLGKLVGASYCAQAGAGGAAFTLCAYDDAAAAGKGAAKRAAMLGEKNAEHAHGALVLSIAPPADEKAAKAAKKLADLFNAIGARPADPAKQ